MKNYITPIALSLITGAITASAQPQERRQKPQRRPDAAYNQRQNACPACGQLQRQEIRTKKQGQPAVEGRRKQQNIQKQQRRGPQQQQVQRRGPQQQQVQRRGPQQQQFKGRGPQLPQRPSPEQRERMQRVRREMLERYDRDGDGRLSERERAAIRRNRERQSGERMPERSGSEGRQRGPQQQR